MTSKTSPSENLVCVYCGEPATTEDHVPPKNLFPSNTTGLIKVPACLSCNNDSSKDDEFFRCVLVNDDRVYQNPEAGEIVAAYERSLRRPQATGLHISMMKKKQRFPLISPAGGNLRRRNLHKNRFYPGKESSGTNNQRPFLS